MPIIALAGLPGTGKSTLARALSTALDAPVFDKDAVRAALYAPDRIEYSREQDELCWELTWRAAELELARRQGGAGGPSAGVEPTRTEFPHCGNFVRGGGAGPRPPACVILDGRTYCRQGQLEALRDNARRAGLHLIVVECVCSEASAHARLAADVAAGRHPAADRNPALHQRLSREAVPIAGPKVVVETDRLELADQVALVLAALVPPAPPAERE